MRKSQESWRTPSLNSRSAGPGYFSNERKHSRSQSELRRGRNNKNLQSEPKIVPFRRNRAHTKFSFKFIESLLEQPLEEAIQKLIGNEYFFDYIGKKLSSDCIVLIVKLLSKFCDCDFTKLRTEILQKSLSSGFVVNLQSYISSIPVQSPNEKKLNSYYWKDPDCFWNNFIKFCDISLKEIPHFFVDNLLKLVKIVLMTIPHIETEHQVHICDETKETFKFMVSQAEEIVMASSRKILTFEKREIVDDDEEEPPEDFHEISIFPTTVELLSTSKPFLRKNVVIGAYRDVNHYLDIQFRLLREDFVGPLRIGIQSHLSGKDQREIQDIKIHRKVQFLNPVTVTEHYCVLLKFHFGGKLGNFKFEDSRKFMYGSLVCFTKDNFNSILFGRIVDRQTEYLKKGQLVIGFDEVEEIVYNADYIMVECSIYFEPYYHVLKVLKQIREEYFPMKNYIIDIDKTVLNPNFSNAVVPYNIEDDGEEKVYYIFNTLSSPTFANLNKSQNDAFIAALRRQFTIIQGPPGTGKTYVGLKVAKTLLKNSHIWFRRSPMLVICFTNHALDQFLEGLIGTTDKIMRIGGQSKNEKLKQFNLRCQGQKIKPAVWEARRKVTSYLNIIKNITDTLNTIARYDSILSIQSLADVIPNFNGSWLADATNEGFLEWLVSGSISEIADLNFEENNENHLVQQFGSIDIEDSESVDETVVDEVNEFDDLLASLESNVQKISLDLYQLKKKIHYCDNRLNVLKSQIQDNKEYLFEYMHLEMRNERLKAIYEFVKVKLASAPRENIEVPPNSDAKRCKYIPINERWNLYFYWLNLYKQRLLDKYERYNVGYRNAYEIYNELKDMGNVEIMKTMEVIGMTTTSAARLHSSLQLLRIPIVIVEEAAEVLEAHIISALTTSCQQLILIGDHQQLRPNTANYKIEKDYKLGISLFERMVQNEVQCFTLDIQHRMRPEISSLIKPAIYPNLKDHESVLHRPLIRGVEKCLYFIDHKNPEESHSGNSKKNIHEAMFLIQLARYLILNGYNSDEITILAAYLGQMFEIQKLQRKTDLLKDVRVSVLDNYQGEESDIILLSLVRNNENTIGFLSIENRVCVALSRARNGLYIMGNMSLLCDKSKLWVKIREKLLDQEAIGSALSLKCQNHGRITMVSTAENFCSVPEGGCDEICNSSLPCDHKCKMLCHALDREHEHYMCTEKCNRLLCDSNLLHICKKMCGEECGLCNYPKNEILECGHKAIMECHINPEDYQCLTQVPVTLPCGHDAIKPCHIETEKYKCRIPCDARLDCGHSCLLNCHSFDDPDHLKYKCPKRCDNFRTGCVNLEDNNHKCTKLCHEECEPCNIIVKKPRTVCPHYYNVPCNKNVDEIECTKPCKNKLSCGHKCKNICGDVCSTCTEQVKKEIPDCKHIVKLPCNVKADRIYCNKKCPRVMVCGHICGGICNMACDPSKCKKMVKVAILAKCGHVVKEVPCFVKTLYSARGVSSIGNLESYCTEQCTAVLNCSPKDKHLCKGSCGSCYQGRIHKRCEEKCSRILICDHKCTGFCRETCKPCLMKCPCKCKHNVCKKRCGDLCTKCKEPCNRNCKHQRCMKKCGEICSFPPCEEVCEKNLKCGHPCIGFCGDPCPPLCRICNKKDVEEFFFGTEDEEDARFILLNDCGHILESSGMKYWMEQSTDKIGFKVCPKCKTCIFTTERYSDYVKKSVEGISKATIKEIGTKDEINEKRMELDLNIQKLSIPSFLLSDLKAPLLKNQNILLNYVQEVNKMNRRKHFNLVELNAIEIKYQLMEQIFNIMKISELNYLSPSLVPPIQNQIELILDNLLRNVDDITSAEIEDIQREINRLHRMIQILPLLKTTSKEKTMSEKIITLNEKINKLSKYDKVLDNFVKQEISELRKKLSLLDITELEKKEIVKAMGLSKGHWYSCPNGHPYVITECGGAMQISECPDCGAGIGGQNHALLETNRVATFMDGATHSAWSDQQNMQNYQF